MNYELERKALLKEALEWEAPSQVTEEFKRRFWQLVEYTIISMLEREDNFFGQFMVQVKREIKLNISWPIATKPEIGGFKMYFNPLLVLLSEEKELQGLIKHEIYHIMLGHYERERSLRNKYSSKVINTAMDLAVNVFIKNLPGWCVRLYGINLEYNLELKEDMTMEQYCEELHKVIKSRRRDDIVLKDKGTIVKEADLEVAHETWDDGELSLENLKEAIKKTALNSYRGKAPENIEKYILEINEKAEIGWSECLKRLIPSVRRGYKKTITRKDRRQPDRLDLRGKLPSVIPELLVAIDISASMSDEEIRKIMIEILDISRSSMAKITVVECDDEIRRVYQLNSQNDIKKRLDKNGSTAFSPVFKYMRDNNMRNHILIYFTDGVGEEKLTTKPINRNTIWVLTGEEELSLEDAYGTVKRLERVESEKYGSDYGLQAMRDCIHDWAR